jgi:hypothetical protein
MGVLVDEDGVYKHQENKQKLLIRSIGRFRREVKADKSGKNPAYKKNGSYFEYNTLEDVLDALDNIQEYGLDFVQYISIDHLVTRVMHIESGEFFDSMMELKTEKETYQSYGSCLSYLRRYALMTMFGLRSADDDSNSSLRGRGISPLVSHKPATSGITSNTSQVSDPTPTNLKEELSKCKTVKEVNAYWVKNFSAKGKQTTDAELELFTNRKQEINNE